MPNARFPGSPEIGTLPILESGVFEDPLTGFKLLGFPGPLMSLGVWEGLAVVSGLMVAAAGVPP